MRGAMAASEATSAGRPAAVLWGECDQWMPVDRAHRLHRAIPHSTLTLIADAGHLIQLGAPVALATELRCWPAPCAAPGQAARDWCAGTPTIRESNAWTTSTTFSRSKVSANLNRRR